MSGSKKWFKWRALVVHFRDTIDGFEIPVVAKSGDGGVSNTTIEECYLDESGNGNYVKEEDAGWLIVLD